MRSTSSADRQLATGNWPERPRPSLELLFKGYAKMSDILMRSVIWTIRRAFWPVASRQLPVASRNGAAA
jgi:hypothetical protein